MGIDTFTNNQAGTPQKSQLASGNTIPGGLTVAAQQADQQAAEKYQNPLQQQQQQPGLNSTAGGSDFQRQQPWEQNQAPSYPLQRQHEQIFTPGNTTTTTTTMPDAEPFLKQSRAENSINAGPTTTSTTTEPLGQQQQQPQQGAASVKEIIKHDAHQLKEQTKELFHDTAKLVDHDLKQLNADGKYVENQLSKGAHQAIESVDETAHAADRNLKRKKE